MPVKLQVVLLPEQKAYLCGEDVTGCVKVQVDAISACNAILVKARGYGEVQWTNDDDENVFRDEEYFSNTITLWSGAYYGNNLMPGEFSFPFSFKLPDKLPSTFEGLYGQVRYVIETWCDMPGNIPQIELARFQVSGAHDLNSLAELAESLPLHKEDTICCCCCEEGPVIVSLSAEKKGYVAGEYILITGEITNRTQKVVEEATITLRQTLKYHGPAGKTKKQKNKLNTVTRQGFGQGATDVWLSYPIRIPDYVISLEHCGIMTATYTIEISFTVGWDMITAENEFIIGTIPVGKVAFNLEGEDGKPSPSAPPLFPSPKPPLPVMEQPQPLPPPAYNPEEVGLLTLTKSA